MNSCGGCNRQIGNEAAIYANKQLFHLPHLQCKPCGFRINVGEKYAVIEGSITCHRCHLERYAPKCAGCRSGIEGRLVKALNRRWHTHCFTCAGCGSIIEDEWLNDAIGPMHRKCYWAFVRDTEMVKSSISTK